LVQWLILHIYLSRSAASAEAISTERRVESPRHAHYDCLS
jgi:hypothetical protein